MCHPVGRCLRVSRITVRRTLAGAALIGSPSGAMRAATPPQSRAAMVAQPATVTVPPVVGLTADSATRALANAGLRALRVPRRTTGFVTGTVIDQSPGARRIVKRGDLDTIFVAALLPLDTRGARGGVVTQPRLTRVPPLARLKRQEADSVLRTRGLLLGNVGARASDSTSDGRVIGQSIPTDSVVVIGTRIDITLGSYAPPPPQPATIRVPELRGVPLRTAAIRLREAGLRLVSVSPVDTSVSAGTVVGQRPPQGTATRRGSPVAVDTSTGMVLVPEVRRQVLASARERLRTKGLVARLGSIAWSVDPMYRDTIVATQDPSVAARVPVGSPVTVTTTAFSQALSDSIARARGDSLNQARRDSADRARRDSIVKARAESAATARVSVPVKPTDWTWILVIAGLVAVGGAAVLVIRRIVKPPSEPPPPESPKPPPRSLPAAGITTGVSGDPPEVSLHVDRAELRGPEIELHTVAAPMGCDIVVAGPSLTLEEKVDAQR